MKFNYNIIFKYVIFCIIFCLLIFIGKQNIKILECKNEINILREEIQTISVTTSTAIQEQSSIIEEQSAIIKDMGSQYDFLCDTIEIVSNQVAYEQAKEEYNNYMPNRLTRAGGVAWFEGHKETYYNLDMTGVVNWAKIRLPKNMQDWEYSVREDGAKLYGDYIIVAADQSIYPYGSIVLTSLGEGIVLDTGTFIYSNPNQIDLAMNW